MSALEAMIINIECCIVKKFDSMYLPYLYHVTCHCAELGRLMPLQLILMRLLVTTKRYRVLHNALFKGVEL